MAEITTEQWLSELDRVAALCNVQLIPEGRGFTVDDLEKRLGVCRSTTVRKIRELLKDGLITTIGKRTGPGGSAVYETIKSDVTEREDKDVR